MNIVLCLNHFMPEQVAGTEVYAWALGKSLQQKGHGIHVVIPNYGKEKNEEYEYDGLLVKKYAEPDIVDRTLIAGKREPAGLRAFEKLIQQLKPDLVHVQELAGSNGVGIYHLRLLKKLQVKMVFTMHLARYSCFCGTLMYKGKEHCTGLIDIKRCTRCALSKLPISNTIQNILYHTSIPLFKAKIDTGKLNSSAGTAFSYPFVISKLKNTLLEIADLCDSLIILTDWYKKVLLDNGVPEQKIRLIKQALPHPAEVTLSKPLKADNSIRLIFIGRIDPLKGLHLLLEAMKNLECDKISLDIYGAINDEGYYDKWKSSTQTLTNIKWNQPIAQEAVVPLIAQFDALVLPSVFSEMSPLVIQEAFAAGVPVIGANVPGISEQLEANINGLLFNFNDSVSLKRVLQSIIDKPTVLYSLRNKMAAPNPFEGVVEATIEVYKNEII